MIRLELCSLLPFIVGIMIGVIMCIRICNNKVKSDIDICTKFSNNVNKGESIGTNKADQ